MLVLNADDNQGIRTLLLAALLRRGDTAGTKALLSVYADKWSAQWLDIRLVLAYRDGRAARPATLKPVRVQIGPPAGRNRAQEWQKVRDDHPQPVPGHRERPGQDRAGATVPLPQILGPDGPVHPRPGIKQWLAIACAQAAMSAAAGEPNRPRSVQGAAQDPETGAPDHDDGGAFLQDGAGGVVLMAVGDQHDFGVTMLDR